jgi:nitroreductase
MLAVMDTRDAIRRRRSTRAFLDTPVGNDVIEDLLEVSAMAPSGGNVQPWKIFVLNGEAMARFRAFLADRPPEAAGYEIYPQSLWEPHRTARFELGEQMYATIDIARDDKPARLAQMAKNFNFFGAPAAFFCFIDKRMGPPQWSDLGMFLQTFMVAAADAGLETCPQEAWTSYTSAVSDFVGAHEDLLLFCGMAIGHEDVDHPINSLRAERLSTDEFVTFVR